jgi:hypothetical protein
MATPLARRPAADGASSQIVPAGSGTAEYAVPASLRSIGAQAVGALGLLTGLWVALSPWFITLQYGGSNGTAVDLISGLSAQRRERARSRPVSRRPARPGGQG